MAVDISVETEISVPREKVASFASDPENAR